ncbi:DUF397 domain-containing protein [Nocardia sp. NPDC001965]
MTNGLPEAQWFKSSYSGPANECVEVAWLDENRVGVRDSKSSDGSALIFGSHAWSAFTTDVRTGQLDVLSARRVRTAPGSTCRVEVE